MSLDTFRSGCSYGVLVAALMVVPAGLQPQSTLVDEGIFEISLNGAPVGSEHFVIRRSDLNRGQLIATGEISITRRGETLELRPALEVRGPSMDVSAYQVKISGSQVEEVYLSVVEGRFHTLSRSALGERERELRAAPGTVLLDLDVAHHYHFLAQRPLGTGRPIPVIVPRDGRQAMLPVSEIGTEELQVAGSPVEARHLRVGDGEEAREIWIDGAGRVIRVEHPSTGYAALRTSMR